MLNFFTQPSTLNMKNTSYIYFAATILLSFSACNVEERSLIPFCKSSHDNPIKHSNKEFIEEETISLKMPVHTKSLVLNSSDFEKPQLGEEHIKDIQNWWQSLPQMVQTQVKNQEVSIELISNIITKDKSLSEQKTDIQIEQTGNALEKVIGMPTDMTYTVNTTVVEKLQSNTNTTNSNISNSNLPKDSIGKTDIVLMQNIAVKLNNFDINLQAFTNTKNDNENFQTLQYWWSNLPIDLQDKIKNHQVIIDFNLIPVANIENTRSDIYPSSLHIFDKVDAYAEVLNRVIGTYKSKTNKVIPIALINKNKNVLTNNTHYTLHINLRNNNKQVSNHSYLQTL